MFVSELGRFMVVPIKYPQLVRFIMLQIIIVGSQCIPFKWKCRNRLETFKIECLHRHIEEIVYQIILLDG